MKKLLMIIMLLSARLTFACSVDDETCMHFFLEAQEMYNRPVPQQQYNNYNSGGRVYVKKPDAWGAVVMDRNLGAVASSGGEASKEEAIKAAQSKCDGDCEAVFIYTNGYVAIVEGKVRGGDYYKGYFGAAPTEYSAKRKAFKECEKEADECKLLGTDKSFF